MATLLHVTGEGQEPLAAFSGHLVRNLEWHRFSPEAVDPTVDTVVASPATPEDAVRLVVDLRATGREHEVVLLGAGSRGWASVGEGLDAVTVVTDLDGLHRLLGADGPEGGVAAGSPAPRGGQLDEAVRRHIPRGGSRRALAERLGDQARPSGYRDDPALWAGLAGDGVPDPWAASTADVAPGPAPDDVPVPLPGHAGDRTGDQTGDRTGHHAGDHLADPARQRAPARGRAEDPEHLVEALLQTTERLYGVRETGTAVAGHVRGVVGVDAVAVLLPDGAVWAVVGAVGHRHLEERLLLGHDHWLVAEVTRARHGVVVEDTDIVRARLAGAPLAAWPHLLACPLPEVDGLVVMARSEQGPAFTSRDLAHASQALSEAGPLLGSAVKVRELARRLRRHADLDEEVSR